MATYTVKVGDTLSKIAKAHNTNVNTIMSINPNITNRNMIRVGQVINLPGPSEKVPNDSKIVEKFREVVRDVQNLDSFNELMEMI